MQEENKRGGKRRRWYVYAGMALLVLVLLAGGFLVFLTAAEYRPEPVQAAEEGGQRRRPVLQGDSLRILSFNTGYSNLGWDSSFLMDGGAGTGQEPLETVEENMAGIEAILLEQDADLYMLQEIDQHSKRTYDIDQLESFGTVLPDYGWSYAPNFHCKFVPYPVQKPFGHMDSGVATFSRYGTEPSERISLPVPFSWPVRTANLKRCLLLTRLPLEDQEREVVIINFHLEAYDSGEGKAAQTRQLLELIQEEYAKGNYVIAGGDFNQTFPAVETEVKPTTQWVPGKLEALPEDWRYVYDDSVPTCRLLNQAYDPESPLTQHYVIDGFILSPNVEVQTMQTLDEGFRYSDHNPVLLQVTLQ